jgi:hypothetical protein
MKYIIIDIRKKAALYGVGDFTLLFNTEEEAINIAEQFFHDKSHFSVVAIKIKPPIAITNFQ